MFVKKKYAMLGKSPYVCYTDWMNIFAKKNNNITFKKDQKKLFKKHF